MNTFICLVLINNFLNFRKTTKLTMHLCFSLISFLLCQPSTLAADATLWDRSVFQLSLSLFYLSICEFPSFWVMVAIEFIIFSHV